MSKLSLSFIVMARLSLSSICAVTILVIPLIASVNACYLRLMAAICLVLQQEFAKWKTRAENECEIRPLLGLLMRAAYPAAQCALGVFGISPSGLLEEINMITRKLNGCAKVVHWLKEIISP